MSITFPVQKYIETELYSIRVSFLYRIKSLSQPPFWNSSHCFNSKQLLIQKVLYV